MTKREAKLLYDAVRASSCQAWEVADDALVIGFSSFCQLLDRLQVDGLSFKDGRLVLDYTVDYDEND